MLRGCQVGGRKARIAKRNLISLPPGGRLFYGGSTFSSADSVTSRENDNQSFSNTLGFASLPRPTGLCLVRAFALRITRYALSATPRWHLSRSERLIYREIAFVVGRSKPLPYRPLTASRSSPGGRAFFIASSPALYKKLPTGSGYSVGNLIILVIFSYLTYPLRSYRGRARRGRRSR